MEIHRQIDKLGRLVIPVDLRKIYGFKPGDKVYFILKEEGIVIRSNVGKVGENEERNEE